MVLREGRRARRDDDVQAHERVDAAVEREPRDGALLERAAPPPATTGPSSFTTPPTFGLSGSTPSTRGDRRACCARRELPAAANNSNDWRRLHEPLPVLERGQASRVAGKRRGRRAVGHGEERHLCGNRVRALHANSNDGVAAVTASTFDGVA